MTTRDRQLAYARSRGCFRLFLSWLEMGGGSGFVILDTTQSRGISHHFLFVNRRVDGNLAAGGWQYIETRPTMSPRTRLPRHLRPDRSAFLC